MILDIHTHNTNAVDAVINACYDDFSPRQGQVYSVGIHPWDTILNHNLELLEQVVRHPAVVAIGECGLDALRGAPIDKQMPLFMHQCQLAETAGKPLIIHCVKAIDRLLQVHKVIKPHVPWIVHGYRGNAATASMLVAKGMYISIGEKFNREAIAAIPQERLLAETDTSATPIKDIRSAIATAMPCASYGGDINLQGILFRGIK